MKLFPPALVAPVAILLFFGLLLMHAGEARGEAMPDPQSPERRPNIIFILADDLGVHDLGCYGRSDHRTPSLDGLAARGIRWEQAYAACPVCSPTRAAWLTGRNPAALHLTTFLPGRGDFTSQKLRQVKIEPGLSPQVGHLVRDLKAVGYQTAMIGKWHLGGRGSQPQDFGFDEVWQAPANTPPSATEGGKHEFGMTRRATDWITKHQSQPFFLYLAHHNPHIPYRAQADRVQRFADSFEPEYAAVIETLDESVGRIMKTLRELKLEEQTWVIFTSDNGGLHVPEGPHLRITHNGPFRAGKGFLYEGGIRVPVIFAGPGVKPGVRDVPIWTCDWRPTLVRLAKAQADQPYPDGQDLSPWILGDEAAAGSADRLLWWHLPHYTNQGSRPSGAIRQGRWKLIEHYETNQLELFDLSKDPGESNNLATEQPELCRRLQAALEQRRVLNQVRRNPLNPGFDPAAHRRLYEDFDPSRYDPRDEKQGAAAQAWRQGMDRATPSPAVVPREKP